MCQGCITVSHANCSQTWQGDMAETPKRPIAASDDCLKKDKKRRLLKAQSTGGSQFACLMEISTPYGHFYFRFISSPSFRGHRFFFGGFESTSSAKKFLITPLMSIIILSNTQLRAHLLKGVFSIEGPFYGTVCR